MNTNFFNKEKETDQSKTEQLWPGASSQNDKEIHTVPNNHHQKFWSLQNMARDLYAHVTSLRPNVYFISTKSSKLSRVASVQHLLCWTHSACSLSTAHVLLILFVTTFTNHLTICFNCYVYLCRASSNT